MPVEREWSALPELPELPEAPRRLRGRGARPDSRDIRKFRRFAKIISFVEAHMKSDVTAYGAKTRAVDAAILHFKMNPDRRAFYKYLKQEQHWIEFEEDYHEYLDFLIRYRDAEARLEKHFSAAECDDLFAAHGIDLLVKLADKCTEIERLRTLFQRSIDDPETWAELKDTLKRSFRRIDP